MLDHGGQLMHDPAQTHWTQTPAQAKAQAQHIQTLSLTSCKWTSTREAGQVLSLRRAREVRQGRQSKAVPGVLVDSRSQRQLRFQLPKEVNVHACLGHTCKDSYLTA